MRLIDPILDAWRQHPADDLPNYAAGSEGPQAADEPLARNGHRWRLLGASVGNTDQTRTEKQA